MQVLRSVRLGCALLAAGLCSGAARAATWFPLGPFGGSARSLAADPADPKHVFLGTATGWIYDSHDGGTTWNRVAQIANRNDLVVDHIVVDRKDPKRLVVAVFTADHLNDGGLFISNDYGKNWYSQAEMRGQSVRSLARSVSDPDELVAGTLKGVFRSTDNGTHWKQISPEGSEEIHEVQSIAIDPANPDVIYAGTWHLPWKTTDGGATWHNIKEGIIDDSDVFSIIVDPKDPKVVYASACSGIYKSTDAGDLFHKVQGIPSAARRTRKLAQDPEQLNTVFAGTTEGLYRTLDAGAQWERLTPSDVIVNDVYIDPTNANHVLMATDRGGVLRSEDGGTTFDASNTGFSSRQVIAFAADMQHPGTVYVGVVNDKATGGVFASPDGGVKWQQMSEGLGGRDVFSLLSLEDGTLLAGTGHGIFHLQDGSWKDASDFEPGMEEGRGAASAPPKARAVPLAPVPKPKPQAVPVAARGVEPARRKGRKPLVRAAAHVSAHKPTAPRGARREVATRRVHATGKGAKGAKGARFVAVRGTAAHSRSGTLRPAGVPQHAPARKPAPPAAAMAPSALAVHRVDAVVYSLVRSGDVLFGGSSTGLLRSGDAGQHWAPVSSLVMPEVHFVAVRTADREAGDTAPGAPMVLAAGLQRLALSPDGGATWDTVALPADLTQIGAVAIDGDKNLWVGGREGVWLSTDYGATWQTLRNLFVTEVDSLFYDPAGHRVLVTAFNSPVVFSVAAGDHKVTYADTGWKLRFARPVGDHLIGATLFDGVVVQPEMVTTPMAPSSASLQ